MPGLTVSRAIDAQTAHDILDSNLISAPQLQRFHHACVHIVSALFTACVGWNLAGHASFALLFDRVKAVRDVIPCEAQYAASEPECSFLTGQGPILVAVAQSGTSTSLCANKNFIAKEVDMPRATSCRARRD